MDNLPMKIMYFALLAMAGWVYFYICVRQLVFDFTVGYRLIKVFDGVKEDVFAAQGARRLNTISVIMWAIICAGFLWLVIHFAATYLIIGFAVGALGALAMYSRRLGPRTRYNFEAFCRTYCRFCTDDALRQAMANCDVPKMHAALKALGSPLRFEFIN